MKKTSAMTGLLGIAAFAGAVTGGIWLKKRKNRIFMRFVKCYRKEKCRLKDN